MGSVDILEIVEKLVMKRVLGGQTGFLEERKGKDLVEKANQYLSLFDLDIF